MIKIDPHDKERKLMNEITINLDDIATRMDETFVAMVRECANEKYTPEKEREIKEMIRKGLETAKYEAYVNAICFGFSEQMVEQIFKNS